MVLLEQIGVMSPVEILPGFYDVDVAANQTDAQLLVAGSASAEGYVALHDGYVIGLTATLSAAASAGSLTIGVSIDGTEDADTRQTVTTGQEVRAKFGIDSHAVRFSAGQQIGVEITTDASWNGTTADLDAQVHIVYDDWDYH
jgi:hypothetical protein